MSFTRRNTRQNNDSGMGMLGQYVERDTRSAVAIFDNPAMDTSGWPSPGGTPPALPPGSESLAWPNPAPPPAPSTFAPMVSLPDMNQAACEQEEFFRDYGGRSASAPEADVFTSAAPWIQQPDGAEPFAMIQAIATPLPGTGDTVIIQFTVPTGFDGVITRVCNFYTGPGFLANLGNMSWRIVRNSATVGGFSNIQLFLGEFYPNGGMIPLEIDRVQVRAGDVVKFVVNHAALSPLPAANTLVIGFLGGYIYPKPTS